MIDSAGNRWNAGAAFACIYAQTNTLLHASGLPRLPLKHELAEIPMIDVGPLNGLGITIMDGPFFSIMPFPARGRHSIHHVRYSPHYEWCDTEVPRDSYDHLRRIAPTSNAPYMLADARRYVPALEGLEPAETLFEVKTVLMQNEVDDGRPILLRPHHGITKFSVLLGAKIDNVYDAVVAIQRLDVALAARGESRSYEGSTQSIRRTTLTRMAMGTRETDQPPLWIATSDLPPSPGHPFYARLTTLLDGHHFDRFVEGLCDRFYAPVMGRPSLAPGRYFRLLLVGYFEGIDSERGIAWRATDSLAVRSFLRLAVDEAPPDHSTIARTRRLIDLETRPDRLYVGATTTRRGRPADG